MSHFFNNYHEYFSKYLSWWFLGLVQNLVTWNQNIGHQAKSKENFVDTLELTFSNWSSWILLKMFVLMISRWILELGDLWHIFHGPVTFLSFSVQVSFSNYWSTEWYLALVKCLCLGQFLSNYCSYSQWYLTHAYILAWPLECSHPYLTLSSISQSIRHATLSYLLI